MKHFFSVLMLVLTCHLLADEPPRYSQPDGYVIAPQTNGLPSGPAELSRSHPGLYADYRGEMFGEGAYYLAAPDQPVANFPHAGWATPAPGSQPLRIVALHRTFAAGMDTYQLGARLGAQVTGVPIAFRDLPKPPQGVRVTDLTMQRLRDALAGPVDVILVNKLLAALPEEAQQLILDKVLAGAGLVLVAHLPARGPLVEALDVANPGAGPDNRYRAFSRVRTSGAWLTGGIRFDLFPSRDTAPLKPWVDFDPRCNNVVSYQFKPDSGATVAAVLDDLPLVIAGTLGKGSYVHLAYCGNIWDGSYIPLFNVGDDAAAVPVAAHYEEQMFSLLAKAVRLAAAGSEPAVQLAWPDGLAGDEVGVRNTGGEPQPVTVQITLRDAVTWQVLASRTDRLTVPPGEAVPVPKLDVPVPAITGLPGEVPPLLEFSLRDAGGNSLDWGNTRYPAVGAVPLATLAADVAFPGEPVAFTLDSAEAVEWRLTDLWGRLVARGANPAGQAGARIAYEPDRLSRLLTLTVDRRDARGQLLARTVREIFTPAFSTERDYYNLIWPRGSNPFGDRHFNYPAMRRQGGIDVVLSVMAQ